jgi:hypothetical protein
MEIRTNILIPAQIEAEIDEFVTFLNTKGINDLTVMYGWACNLNYKELYQKIPLATEKLKQFIVQSIENGVYKIGQCDLFIQTNQDELEFVLCHEADIHFKTTNALLVQEMKSNWQAKDYQWYEVGKA